MDIVILGGGVIGLTLANLLLKYTYHNITVVSPLQSDSDRYSALTTASKNIFMDLGIWQQVLDRGVGLYDKMHLQDYPTKAVININAHDFGAPELGHIVNNKVLGQVLYRSLQGTRVKFIEGIATDLVDCAGKKTVITNNNQITADLLIGADGGNSWLRSQLSIYCYNYSYKHNAIVATVRTSGEHDNTATQIFYPDGPLAFLPLVDKNLCSIVWSTTTLHADKLMQMNDLDFAERLNVEEICSKRFCFPLHMKHVEQYVGNDWALVGDAAHVIHPLAGQGMNLGLLDVASLAENLSNVNISNLYRALRTYERERKTRNWEMIGLMEFCKRLFASKNPIVSSARGVGMRVLDRFNPAKNIFTKIGMGVYGELPVIARGYL